MAFPDILFAILKCGTTNKSLNWIHQNPLCLSHVTDLHYTIWLYVSHKHSISEKMFRWSESAAKHKKMKGWGRQRCNKHRGSSSYILLAKFFSRLTSATKAFQQVLYFCMNCLIRSCRLTSCVFINHGDGFPLVELHYVQHSSAQQGIFRMEVNVEVIFVVHWGVFPAGLDVRDLQGITNRLDCADRGAVRGPKHGPDSQSQLVTRWRQETDQFSY